MRRIMFGLFCCALAVCGCAPGGGGSSVAPARSAQGAFAVPKAISRAVPPAGPAFVPKPPPSGTSSVRRTSSNASQSAFFAGAVPLSNGVYYLTLPGGNVFGYYSYLQDPNYIYHFDMGYEYVYDAGDGNGGVYLYDFASSHWWYTSRRYEFPYVYDFSLNSVLYYYPDSQNAGHYTTNPRYFYDFATGQVIQLPAPPPPSTKATQRAQVQALLTVSKVLDTGGYYPGYPTLGPMNRGRRPQSAEPVRSTVCSPGGANGDGSASYSSTSDSQGLHEVYSDFYSPNCANTERITTLNEPTSNTQHQGVSTGFTTEYNRAGAVIGYATNQQSYNDTLLTVAMSDAKTVGGAQVGQSGASCVPTTSTSVVRCNLASFMAAGGETTGLLETVTETYSSSGTWSAQISATTYAGSGLSLVPPPAGGSTWGIQGGTQIDSLSGSGTAAYNESFAKQLDYTTTSNPGGFSATAHLVFSNATLTITVSKNGATVATAVVDGDGNGTVTYADNSTDTVAGFTIFS